MKENLPLLTLNMAEKVYLATAKSNLEKISFVYTLACLKDAKNSNSFIATPVPEIHTFKDANAANLYFATIDRIVEINASNQNLQFLFNINEEAIERFLENTK